MQPRSSMSQKRPHYTQQDNRIETSHDGFVNGMAKTTAKAFGDIGAGVGKGLLDLITGVSPTKESTKRHERNASYAEPGSFQRKGAYKELYNFKSEQEKKEIQYLMKQVNEQVKALKKSGSRLVGELKDVEKLTLSSAAEKPGIYHIRFLEQVLSFIKTLQQKINNSSTWLEAMQSKKMKRGSAFAVRSKDKGSQYSQSDEMKITRSVQ